MRMLDAFTDRALPIVNAQLFATFSIRLCVPLQIGMHFMNPVPVMQLVELTKGMHTSQQTFEACKGLAEFLGKQVGRWGLSV